MRLAFLSRLALGVMETANGNEMLASAFTFVAPCSGLAKYCDPAMASIHASEIDRLGPGPVTLSCTDPMAAEVVGVAVPELVAGDAVVVDADDVDELEPEAGAWVTPVNDCTFAVEGVIEIRLPRTSGQSTAELSTEARRLTPAV